MSDDKIISLNKEVLRQVLKDGRTYPTLAKQMAEVILSEMKDDGLPDAAEFIEWGSVYAMEQDDYKAVAKKIADATGLPVYAEDEGKNRIVPSVGTVYIKQLKRYQFGE